MKSCLIYGWETATNPHQDTEGICCKKKRTRTEGSRSGEVARDVKGAEAAPITRNQSQQGLLPLSMLGVKAEGS